MVSRGAATGKALRTTSILRSKGELEVQLILQKENAFGTHIEQEVENAEIGEETSLGRKDLIVGLGREERIGLRTLGHDGIAIIDNIVIQQVALDILLCQRDGRTHVEQGAYYGTNLHVEVEKEVVATIEERVKVVGIVFEERRLAISSLQRIPMELTPAPVVADAQVSYGTAVEVDALRALDGHGECLRSVGCCNDAAVAEGLLGVVLARLYKHSVGGVQLLVPLYWSEICC